MNKTKIETGGCLGIVKARIERGHKKSRPVVSMNDAGGLIKNCLS